jgi:prepilin-type N-terminal cleavage/methylation domain-containing protein/prepilin-type processing-associated H-X9-DG protein
MVQRRGFTLIEILVVISIIALLIGIVLPALRRARATAQRIECASNQKQVGLGFHLYAADHQGYIPFAVNRIDSKTRWSFDDAIAEYIGSNLSSTEKDEKNLPANKANEILICPSDQAQDAKRAKRSYAMVQAQMLADDTPAGVASTFTVKASFGSIPAKLGPQFRIGSSDIPQASSTLLMSGRSFQANGVVFPINSQGSIEDAVMENADQQMPGIDSFGRIVMHTHGSKNKPVYNYLFVDGHVSPYEPEQTIGNVDVSSDQPQGYWTRSVQD